MKRVFAILAGLMTLPARGMRNQLSGASRRQLLAVDGAAVECISTGFYRLVQ